MYSLVGTYPHSGKKNSKHLPDIMNFGSYIGIYYALELPCIRKMNGPLEFHVPNTILCKFYFSFISFIKSNK